MFFQNGIGFFDHHHFIHRGGKLPDQIIGERERPAQLEDRGIREQFPAMKRRDSAGDDPQLFIAALHDIVQFFPGTGICRHTIEPFLGIDAHFSAPKRQGNELGRLFFEVGNGFFRDLTFPFQQTAGVAHASGRPQDHRTMMFLGDLKRRDHKIPRFSGVGRFQDGQFCHAGILAGILFGLTGVLTGVIRHADHHAADHADIREGHHGIGSHIQAHVFHGHDAADSGVSGTGSGFKSHFFVGTPFAIDAGIFHQIFQNFGRGSAGVAESSGTAALIRAQRDRLVAGKEFTHFSFLRGEIPPRA